jgi:hypothetical protein
LAGRLGGVFAALMAAAGFALGVPAAGHAALPPLFVGLSSDRVYWEASDTAAADAIDAQRRAGVEVARIGLRWADLETSPGSWDYSLSDRVIHRLAEGGIRALPVLQTPPAFASSAPLGVDDPGMYPPASNGQFAEFAVRMLKRYGRDGEFWHEHAQLPYLPVTAWQVWNEPNISPWWPSGPNAAEYVGLLRATSVALRAADPNAEIVAAGIPESTLGIPQQRFLRDMYEAGAKGAFDTLAVHGYASSVDGLMGQLRETRQLMSDYKDSAPIWLTEFGWATGGAVSAFTTSDAGQAERIDQAIRTLAAQRETLGVRGFMVFTWQDLKGYGSRWSNFCGLVRADGSWKPAVLSFAHAVRAIREAAGEVLAPQVELAPPDPVVPDEPAAPNAPSEPASVGPDADPPAQAREAVFRVLHASHRGRAARQTLTYFPARGESLTLSGVRLPFAVADGCRRGCRLRAVYGVSVRDADRPWRRLRVPAQKVTLAPGHGRVLRVALRRAQAERVRRARRVRVSVTLALTPTRRSERVTGTLMLLLAPA